MATITNRIMNFKGVVRNDAFSFSFVLLTNIDLTGKKFIMQVRLSAMDKLWLEFKESDNTLRVGPVTAIDSRKTQRTIGFYMDANKMTLPSNIYKYGLSAYSDTTDKINLIKGVFQVVDEIPKI